MADYELVLLDMDDTLFDYGRSVAEALQALAAHFGLPWDPISDLAKYHAVTAEVWGEVRNGLIALRNVNRERVRRLFAGEELDFEAVSDTYESYIVRFWHLVDGAKEACRYLTPKCMLAIVTNGPPELQKPRVSISPLSKYIPLERVFVAEDVGFRKPDPRMLQHVFSALGYSDKKTAIMIGDSLTEDIQGGHNFGIDTCWYNPAGQHALDDIRPTFTIRSLRELMDLL